MCLLSDSNVHDVRILLKALNAPGEKEYFLASAFSEFYCAPSASFTLRGLAVSGKRAPHCHDCCPQEWPGEGCGQSAASRPPACAQAAL